MPSWSLALVFVAGASLSLATSWVLVSRLERIGARLSFPESVLGLLAALAGDAPEIAAATTALIGHSGQIGAGVVIGSNVFNLAALLGLTALVAGRIALRRRVIVLEGALALCVGAVCVAVVTGGLAPVVGLALSLAMFVPYLLALAQRRWLTAMRLPARWQAWIAQAVIEEERELEGAIQPRPGGLRDGLAAVAAVAVVVAASIAMEQAGSRLGGRAGLAPIVTGGVVLAAVTSLPNLVAAIYLARRGRGAATLSVAMNSNALNVIAGLLLPAAFTGFVCTPQTTLLGASYLALTACALAAAYRQAGLGRRSGTFVIGAYAALVAVLVLWK